ncbi:MAG: hypothetical protein WEA77_01670 [Hyphomonas sp.]|uniref:hypothetical protein n=1 Tax=Hyphomonas sp. TaxID=87 RepID=UPI0034A0A0C6
MFETATTFDTPAGLCGLGWTEAGLTRVRPFAERRAIAAAPSSAQVPGSEAPPHIAALITGLITGLRAFLSGAPTHVYDTALDMTGMSDFEAALCAACARSPGAGPSPMASWPAAWAPIPVPRAPPAC